MGRRRVKLWKMMKCKGEVESSGGGKEGRERLEEV